MTVADRPPDPPRRSAVSDRRLAALIALGLLAVSLVFYRGVLKNSADEWFMFSLADSLARNGHLDVDQMAYVGEFKGLAKFGPDGHLYSKYSVLQSILAAPLVWIGRWLPAAGQAQLTLLVNPVLTALTGAAIFGIGRRLGYGRAASAGTALAFGLLTPALVYSKTLTSEVSTGLGLAVAILAILHLRSGGGARWAAVAGAAIGAVVLSKAANAVVAPGLLIGIWFAGRRNPRIWPAALLPLIGFAALTLGYNWARFGDPLDTGYGPTDGTFSADWLVSIPGLLVSPGRGILLYAPILWLAVAGSIPFARRHRQAALVLGLTALPFALTYAKWHGWHGGLAAWGPRYWIPLLPIFCLPLLEIFARLGRPRRSPAWAGVAALIALSLTLQFGASAFNTLVYVDEFGRARRIDLLNEDRELTQLAYEPAASPLIHQWRFARPRFSDLSWARPGPAGGLAFDRVAAIALAAGLVSVAAAAGLTARGRAGRISLAVAGAVLATSGFVLAAREAAAIDRANPDWTAAIAEVQARSSGSAAVVTLGIDPLAVTFTRLKTGLDHYGLSLPPAEGPDPVMRRWLELARAGRREVWLIRPIDAPESTAALGRLIGDPAEVRRIGSVAIERYAAGN